MKNFRKTVSFPLTLYLAGFITSYFWHFEHNPLRNKLPPQLVAESNRRLDKRERIPTPVDLAFSHLIDSPSSEPTLSVAEQLRQAAARKHPKNWQKAKCEMVFSRHRYSDPTYLASLSRWQDPEGTRRMNMSDAFRSDPTGRTFNSMISNSGNPVAALMIEARANPSGNWSKTADFYTNLTDVSSVDRANMIDLVVGGWMQNDAQAPTAIAWLHKHAGDPAFDQARQTAFLLAKKPDATLAGEFSSEARRSETLQARQVLDSY